MLAINAIAEQSLSLVDEILYDLDPDLADVAPELIARHRQLRLAMLEINGQLPLELGAAEELQQEAGHA